MADSPSGSGTCRYPLPADPATKIADNRADLVRRFFAVAISAGLTSTLIQMDWFKNGTRPTAQEFNEMWILATGLVLTILSWEGYLRSIGKRPLKRWPRFLIDVVLVTLYMAFLASAKNEIFFLPILGLVFLLYVIWDIFSIWEYPAEYDKTPASSDTGSIGLVARVYSRGAQNRARFNRGPIITLSWALYVGGLLLLHYWQSHTVALDCLAATTGLILYRVDKSQTTDDSDITGFPMAVRFCTIAGLLILVALTPSLCLAYV